MWLSYFYKDCKRIYISSQGNPLLKLIKLVFVPSVHIMLVQRIGHAIIHLWPPFNWILAIPYAICSTIIKILYNTSVPARTEIGPGFIILHPGAIYIHPYAKIGKNVTTSYCVAIGAAKLSDTKYPVIGDFVTIGVGAKILGPIVVNHHAIIGANAAVLHNVPAYGVVGGVPAHVIKIQKPKRHHRHPRKQKRPDNRNRNARIRTDNRDGIIHVK